MPAELLALPEMAKKYVPCTVHSAWEAYRGGRLSQTHVEIDKRRQSRWPSERRFG